MPNFRIDSDVPACWDLASMKNMFSKRELGHYHLACIMLYVDIMRAQYHRKTNPHARTAAHDMYEQLFAILHTRAPGDGVDVVITYVYTPGTGTPNDMERYEHVFERKPHQNASLDDAGKVVLVDAPYKVRTSKEHDLLMDTVAEVETTYLGALVYRLKRRYTCLWSSMVLKLKSPTNP